MDKTDELFDSFGITFLDRSGTKTNFKITECQNTYDNLEMILKLVCFYTSAIFETDSTERKIYYTLRDEICSDTIDNVIRMLFKEWSKPVEKIDSETDSDSDSDSDSEYQSSYTEPKDESKIQEWTDHYQDDTTDEYVSTFDQGLKNRFPSTPIIKYTFTNDVYETKAKISSSKRDKIHDFETDGTLRNVVIKEKLGEYKEVVGNWGDYTKGPKTFLRSGTEDKYVCFDFDEFGVDVEKISELEYNCTFSKTYPIHHAASMWARNCLVECTHKYISQVQLVNEVKMKLRKENGLIYVETTYLAINCL